MTDTLSRRRVLGLLGAGAALSVLAPGTALAQAGAKGGKKKVKCTIAGSIYTGWMFWYFAADNGILKKWGDRYGVEFEFQKCVDYPTSLNIYAAGDAQALVVTNMDVLTLGVPSRVIVVGDYSNGNDALISRDGLGMKDLAGREVTLVENSVSHYLFERACELHGVDPSKVTVVNTSDANIGPAFIQTRAQKFTVTWNPIVLQIMQTPGTQVLVDSSKIPGEIQDLLVMNEDFAKANPEAAMALAGAWYEVMGIAGGRTTAATEAIAYMAKEAGNTVAEFKTQLGTTAMFWTPAEAIAFASGQDNKDRNTKVRTFLGKRQLLGKDGGGRFLTADQVGIRFPDGTVQGDPNNVLLTYDNTYMQMAKDGKLEGLPAQPAGN